MELRPNGSVNISMALFEMIRGSKHCRYFHFFIHHQEDKSSERAPPIVTTSFSLERNTYTGESTHDAWTERHIKQVTLVDVHLSL